MRVTPLFLLAATVFAQDGDGRKADPFVTAMRVFELAKEKTTKPGARAVVHPAIDGLVKTHDPRAIQPLCAYLNETRVLEPVIAAQGKKLQRVGAAAQERMQVLQRELSQLRLKERAGDTRAGPQIERRVNEMRELAATFEETVERVRRTDLQLDFVVKLRERLARGCSTVLANAKNSDAADAGLTQLRRALDIADHVQALYCVRILRDSKQAAAEEHLLQVFAHPKADDAVTRATIHALTKVLTKRGARALLDRWQSDPKRYGPEVQHALSSVARARLADPAAAEKWVNSLPE